MACDRPRQAAHPVPRRPSDQRFQTRIIAALEERYKEPPLYPREPALRKRALELEDDFDETLGPALRASIITPIFRQDRDIALRLLTTGMPEAAYRRLRSVARIFPAFYRFRHKISDRRLENDRAAVSAALDRIERERAMTAAPISSALYGKCRGYYVETGRLLASGYGHRALIALKNVLTGATSRSRGWLPPLVNKL